MEYKIRFYPYKGEKIPPYFEHDQDSKDMVNFLNKSAKKCVRELISKIFIIKSDESDFLGYIAISLRSIEKDKLSTEKQRALYARPAIVIGQLIIDKRYQGKGYGRAAVKFVIAIAKLLKTYLPCRLLVVDAINENAKKFYEKLGFRAIPDNPLTLVLDLLPLFKTL